MKTFTYKGGTVENMQTQRRSKANEVRDRILSGVVLVALMIGLIYLGGRPLFAGTLVAVVIASIELCDVWKAKGYHPLLPLGLLISTALVVNAQFNLRLGGPVLLATAAAVVLLPRFTRHTLRDLALTSAGAVYVGLLIGYALLLRALPEGLGWMLMVVFGVGGADVSAYAIGSLFGKHKLAPRISPNKTWEGVAGGLAGCLLILALLNLLLGITSWPVVLALAPVLTFCDAVGDLWASHVKRFAGVKNFGRLIPGHGGLLDRIDGLLAALPIAYWVILAVTGGLANHPL